MTPEPRTFDQPDWEMLQRRALMLSAAGTGLFIVYGLVRRFAEGLTDIHQYFAAYLVAYVFWLSLPLGSLVLLMIQHLTGGAWGILLRRILEAGTRTLLPLMVLFLPIVGGLFLRTDAIYLWARPEDAIPAAYRQVLSEKSAYLNVESFIIRAAIYFACWLVLTFLLNRWSDARDATETARRRSGALSGPGLVLYALSITFASMDWVMSLEPAWSSTVYPLLFAMGQILTALAFAVGVLILLSRTKLMADAVEGKHLRDLGGLMLAFVMFWAYMQVSQFLLIWVGNLPEEIPWYLRRTRGGWQWVAIALILLHFTLPLLLLLFRDIKESARALAGVAAGLLVLRFVDVFWWIEPVSSHRGEPFFWLLDVAALAAVGGLCCWWFVRELKSRPLLPASTDCERGEAGHE